MLCVFYVVLERAFVLAAGGLRADVCSSDLVWGCLVGRVVGVLGGGVCGGGVWWGCVVEACGGGVWWGCVVEVCGRGVCGGGVWWKRVVEVCGASRTRKTPTLLTLQSHPGLQVVHLQLQPLEGAVGVAGLPLVGDQHGDDGDEEHAAAGTDADDGGQRQDAV